MTSMAIEKYEHQYTSLVATLSKRDGINAILNGESEEKQDKVTTKIKESRKSHLLWPAMP